MDLRQLEIFVTAYEKGSLSRAAECLNTSQPNVSKNIRALEEELGRPLLVRSGKGVQPTAFGRAVLEYAMIMRKAAEKLASLAVPEGENSLRLSAYPSRMIPQLLVDFYQAWGEDAHIEYHQGSVVRSWTRSTRVFQSWASFSLPKSGWRSFGTSSAISG